MKSQGAASKEFWLPQQETAQETGPRGRTMEEKYNEKLRSLRFAGKETPHGLVIKEQGSSGIEYPENKCLQSLEEGPAKVKPTPQGPTRL